MFGSKRRLMPTIYERDNAQTLQVESLDFSKWVRSIPSSNERFQVLGKELDLCRFKVGQHII